MKAKQARILIVDDVAENIDVLGAVLSDYTRLVATNGEKALQRARSEPHPQLILLDVMMPGMDGFEVCRRLKDDPKTADIPVIFVTALGAVDDETHGLELGAVDYVTKPISPPVVQARVKTHLALSEAKKELAADIKKAGEESAYEVGVAGLNPKLVQLLGRLKYRTSYGQNVLMHSIEVAQIGALLAEELGANVAVVKKGGLLHDIGKAIDHEVQGGHPEIGYDIMKKFNLPEEVSYIAIAHHEDSPRTLEGIIVKAADAISSSRPGARKDTYEQYIQRLDELEQLATDFEGVEKSYAIQAGREIRVFVKPEEIDDFTAQKLARQVADRIEEELRYPGEIKVNVIREKRIVEYAR